MNLLMHKFTSTHSRIRTHMSDCVTPALCYIYFKFSRISTLDMVVQFSVLVLEEGNPLGFLL